MLLSQHSLRKHVHTPPLPWFWRGVVGKPLIKVREEIKKWSLGSKGLEFIKSIRGKRVEKDSFWGNICKTFNNKDLKNRQTKQDSFCRNWKATRTGWILEENLSTCLNRESYLMMAAMHPKKKFLNYKKQFLSFLCHFSKRLTNNQFQHKEPRGWGEWPWQSHSG